MRIGDLRHKVELQSYATVADGMGGGTATWTTQDRVRAAIWPVSAVEQVKAGAPTMSLTHRIRIRYFEDIRADWRIKFGARYFSVVSIVNKDEKGAQMDLLCREVVA